MMMRGFWGALVAHLLLVSYWTVSCVTPEQELRIGDDVIVESDFTSDSADKALVTKGQRGKVMDLDGVFALVDFSDLGGQWVWKENFPSLRRVVADQPGAAAGATSPSVMRREPAARQSMTAAQFGAGGEVTLGHGRIPGASSAMEVKRVDVTSSDSDENAAGVEVELPPDASIAERLFEGRLTREKAEAQLAKEQQIASVLEGSGSTGGGIDTGLADAAKRAHGPLGSHRSDHCVVSLQNRFMGSFDYICDMTISVLQWKEGDAWVEGMPHRQSACHSYAFMKLVAQEDTPPDCKSGTACPACTHPPGQVVHTIRVKYASALNGGTCGPCTTDTSVMQHAEVANATATAKAVALTDMRSGALD